MMRVRSAARRWALVLSVVLAAGCGSGRYPVEGQVVWSDGTPAVELDGGAVEFQSPDTKATATGDIGKDGKFRLTTEKPFDGAAPGKYRVIVRQGGMDGDRPPPRVLASKYESYGKSGIEKVVEAKRNQITIEVERVKKK